MREVIRWAIQWRSDSRLDGKVSHIMWDGVYPYLFRTRREARALIQEKWGYIKRRPDLRREPHGWKMPRPVRVTVTMQLTAAGRDENALDAAPGTP